MDNRKLQPDTWEQAGKIRLICEENSFVTLSDIGKQLGISRQRVHQIILRNNNSVGIYKSVKPIVRHRPIAKKYYCLDCDKKLLGIRKSNRCNSCSVKSNSITATCGTCGNEFTLLGRQASARRANVKFGIVKHSENIFCSKKCSGKFIGNNYGFAYTVWGKKRTL